MRKTCPVRSPYRRRLRSFNMQTDSTPKFAPSRLDYPAIFAVASISWIVCIIMISRRQPVEYECRRLSRPKLNSRRDGTRKIAATCFTESIRVDAADGVEVNWSVSKVCSGPGWAHPKISLPLLDLNRAKKTNCGCVIISWTGYE